jgi:hypothetical protein
MTWFLIATPSPIVLMVSAAASTPGRPKKLVLQPSAKISNQTEVDEGARLHREISATRRSFEIDRFNRTDKRLYPLKKFAQGIDDSIEFEIACSYLRHHRRE